MDKDTMNFDSFNASFKPANFFLLIFNCKMWYILLVLNSLLGLGFVSSIGETDV